MAITPQAVEFLLFRTEQLTTAWESTGGDPWLTEVRSSYSWY